MKNELQVFTSEEFGSIRTTAIEGRPWFVGKDVAVALGYSNPQKAVRDHVDDDDRTVNDSFTVNGTPVTLINESGLYALTLSSKLPTAKKFKRWITGEVLPAIRQHGAYFTDDALVKLLSDPRQAHLLIMEYVQEAVENERLNKQIREMIPKAAYYDAFVNPMDCTTIRLTAKELGVPERKFVRYLLRHRYLYRAHSGKLMPYAYYLNRGFFTVKDFHKLRSPETGQYTLFTAAGKQHFMDKVTEILKEAD